MWRWGQSTSGKGRQGIYIPCDQRRTTTVNLDAANLDLLVIALEKVGYSNVAKTADTVAFYVTGQGWGSWRGGKLTVPERTDVDSIKRAYTRANVEDAAKRFGWAVKTADATPVMAGLSRKW